MLHPTCSPAHPQPHLVSELCDLEHLPHLFSKRKEQHTQLQEWILGRGSAASWLWGLEQVINISLSFRYLLHKIKILIRTQKSIVQAKRGNALKAALRYTFQVESRAVY